MSPLTLNMARSAKSQMRPAGKNKYAEMIEVSKELTNASLVEGGGDEEYSVSGYLLKILTKKMNKGGQEQEVWKFFLMTAENEIVCVDVLDRGFIYQRCFPKENSYIFLDNVGMDSFTVINHTDLSFETFSTA